MHDIVAGGGGVAADAVVVVSLLFSYDLQLYYSGKALSLHFHMILVFVLTSFQLV